MNKKILLLVLGSTFLLSGCRFNIGLPNRTNDAPAPTTVPLPQTGKSSPGSLAAPEKPVTLPPGFQINVYASGLDGPRMMAIGPDGQLYVAERGADRVIRLPDADGNGQADAVQVVYGDLNEPNSVAFAPDGSLYVSETERVLRLSQPDGQGAFQKAEAVINSLPKGGHSTRTLLFSPDGSALYVSIGSSCNACEEDDPQRGVVMRYRPDGTGEGEIFARGLRNPVGITFRPGSDELWATDNGRDLMGDDLPPEVVWKLEEGQNYGWPYCHAGRVIDPDLGKADSCNGIPKPQVEITAHSAPLGLAFYTGQQFPAEYQGGLFVALHGSWNRSTPTGYKVVFMPYQDGKLGTVQDFATGWLDGQDVWGRPVDPVVAPDGSLLVSDDQGGTIYRIFYQP